ncbi:hypothetical protein Ppa06_57880 [Planomonospora parontospora subsp. parontospora]|uniref:Uncharacterized protein n=2 Tax=Planomonospora parontospora TaxID=58119 RepID=A0AA37BLY6_9ACTN|nr:hypothetical protein [Planomonospora parontospora]GGK90464.1 hypothetical protein GCM10010126_57430 [Planomonospora parontospora]GII11990.1 hypothetical protein Ppa06_57880 [Planomonospora parontospora subsp. parontospora]
MATDPDDPFNTFWNARVHELYERLRGLTVDHTAWTVAREYVADLIAEGVRPPVKDLPDVIKNTRAKNARTGLAAEPEPVCVWVTYRTGDEERCATHGNATRDAHP